MHRAAIGRAVWQAAQRKGWNLDEFATAMGRDARQVRRWCSGEERPLFDVLFPVLGTDLLITLAGVVRDVARSMAADKAVEVITTITIRDAA